MSGWEDLKWGWRRGAFFAAFFTVIAGLIFLLAGGDGDEQPPMSFGRLAAAYAVGGFLGGGMLGLLRTHIRTKERAAVAGMLVALPGYLAIAYALRASGAGGNDPPLASAAIAAIIVGGYCGAKEWESSHRGGANE